MTEIWKPVPVEEFSHLYAVSNHGRIKRVGSDRVLKPMRTGTRRPGSQRSKVRFSTNPRKDFDVAALVLGAFVGPRPEGCHALHNDDNSANNRLDNLRWGTPTENMHDMIIRGRGANQKIQAKDVVEIRRRCQQGERGVDLAREYGVSQQRICDIAKGRSALLALMEGTHMS